MFVSPVKSAARLHRDYATRVFMSPSIAIINKDVDMDTWKSNYKLNVSELQTQICKHNVIMQCFVGTISVYGVLTFGHLF